MEKVMNSEKLFYIKNPKTKKPSSLCSIYVDGTGGKEFREGIDYELSHWIPNKTQDQYKAGTSTEICFKFLKQQPSTPYDLVINNHMDIDGILSTFVLVYPEFALQHQSTLEEASKTGDFWAWAEGKSLTLFQELTQLYRNLEQQKVDLQKAYEVCFDFILKLLQSPEIHSPAQEILEKQFSLIGQGKIKRKEITPHFVSYYVPFYLTKGKVNEFLKVPGPDTPLSEEVAFWPQVRNRLDSEKIQLVAIETEKGMHYDLWYPGYVWADTYGLWLPEGLRERDASITIEKPALTNAIEELNKAETGLCTWKFFPCLHILSRGNPRGFPVVVSTLNKENEKLESTLDQQTVINLLNIF